MIQQKWLYVALLLVTSAFNRLWDKYCPWKQGQR